MAEETGGGNGGGWWSVFCILTVDLICEGFGKNISRPVWDVEGC